jgi:hypothetical protein
MEEVIEEKLLDLLIGWIYWQLILVPVIWG